MRRNTSPASGGGGAAMSRRGRTFDFCAALTSWTPTVARAVWHILPGRRCLEHLKDIDCHFHSILLTI